eukprot:2226560-Prymnesium_polylepis.1
MSRTYVIRAVHPIDHNPRRNSTFKRSHAFAAHKQMAMLTTVDVSAPLSSRHTNELLSISHDADRGVATLKPSSPIMKRSPTKVARAQVRQKARTVSTTKPSAEETADTDFLDHVAKGQMDVVRSLIESGQDVNVADERGESALHKA